jgi:hypothetical protein
VPLSVNVSASQIKTVDMCTRKWWFDKVANVRERQKHHFHLGHALHAIGEHFLLGQFTNEDDLYFPGWSDGLEDFEQVWMKKVVRRAVATGIWSALPEAYIEFPILYLLGDQHRDADGLPLMAAANTYVDKDKVRRHGKPLQLIDGRPLPRGWDDLPLFVGFIDVMQLGRSPAIIDHKSAKSRKYALTAKELADDSQVLSYAAAAWQLSGARQPIRLRHNVFIKAEVKPELQVFKTDAVAPLEAIQRQWEHNRTVVKKMILLRQQAPKINDPDVRKRANNYLKVPSALDQGRVREACDCYGGCPFREACFGRARIETVVQQLDAPDPFGAVIASRDEGRKAKQYGALILTNAHHPVVPGTTHMFNKPAPTTPAPVTLGSDAYVREPENPKKQYKARVIAFGGAPGSGDLVVALWPVPNVAPNFDTLPATYGTTLPAAALSSVPHPDAELVGYVTALTEGGYPQDKTMWEPAQGVDAVAATVGSAKIAKREDVVSPFGPMQGVSVPVTAPKAAPVINPTAPAEQGALEHLPVVTTPAAIGTVLRVADTKHAYWGKLKGKLAKVMAVSPGDDGSLMYAVEIEGFPYPDVHAGRFELIPVAGGPAGYNPAADLQTRALSLKGQLVTITLKNGALYNVSLDDVNEVGISAIAGQITPTWEEIADITPLTQQGIPHLDVPKGKGKVLANMEADTAAGKAKTAKQLEKEAKAAEKQRIADEKAAAKQQVVDAKAAAAKAAADLKALLDAKKNKPAPVAAAAPAGEPEDITVHPVVAPVPPVISTTSTLAAAQPITAQPPAQAVALAAAAQAQAIVDPLTVAADLLRSILMSDRLNRTQLEALVPLIEQARANRAPITVGFSKDELRTKFAEVSVVLNQFASMAETVGR